MTKKGKVALITDEYIYRAPVLIAGKWRGRRRRKDTAKIETFLLEAESKTKALQEVDRLVQAQREKERERTPDEIHLKDAFDKWAGTFDVKNSTLAEYKYSIKLYKNNLPNIPVSEITLSDLEKLFFKTMATRAGRTKLKHLAMIKNFLAWCQAHNYASENVAVQFREVHSLKKWRKEVRVAKEEKGQALSFEEAQKLLEACKEKYTVKLEGGRDIEGDKLFDRVEAHTEFEPPPHLYLFVLMSLRTGLRSGNLCGNNAIRWKEIDFKNGILQIEGSFMKNGRLFRVPIHDEIRQYLKRVRLNLENPLDDSQPIFRIAKLPHSFKSALKRAGLEERGFRIHDLRHTFATWLGEHCPYAVMQKLLGHAPSTVTDRYSHHLDIEVLRHALNKLPWLTRTLSHKTAESRFTQA